MLVLRIIPDLSTTLLLLLSYDTNITKNSVNDRVYLHTNISYSHFLITYSHLSNTHEFICIFILCFTANSHVAPFSVTTQHGSFDQRLPW